MKIKKVYDEIIGAWLKDGRLILGRHEDKILFSAEGFKAFILTENEFPFDYEKILDGREAMNSSTVKDLLRESDHEEAWKTGDMRLTKRGTQVFKIANEKTHAWVDVKLLNAFEKDCTFKIKGPKNQVFVYEDEVLRGFVMPTRIEESDF